MILIMLLIVVVVAAFFATLPLMAGFKLKREIIRKKLVKEGWDFEVSGFTACYQKDNWWMIYVNFNKIGQPYIWTIERCWFNTKTKEIKEFNPWVYIDSKKIEITQKIGVKK